MHKEAGCHSCQNAEEGDGTPLFKATLPSFSCADYLCKF
jgi:hypothetical protein